MEDEIIAFFINERGYSPDEAIDYLLSFPNKATADFLQSHPEKKVEKTN